jgi:hypothetical protein
MEEKTITGKVISVNVKGSPSTTAAAQLLFSVEKKRGGEKRAIVVTAGYAPQVFSAMATLVIAAYFSNKRITVGYEPKEGGTDLAVEVFVPSDDSV